MKRKKTPEESDAMDHSDNFCHPAHDGEQQQLQQQQYSNTLRSSSSSRSTWQIYANTRTAYSIIIIVIALDEMHSSAVLSLFGLFFCQVPVGVGESDARDESAPAQTSPQHAGFGSDRLSAFWRSVLMVVFVRQMITKFTQHRI